MIEGLQWETDSKGGAEERWIMEESGRHKLMILKKIERRLEEGGKKQWVTKGGDVLTEWINTSTIKLLLLKYIINALINVILVPS